MIKKLFLGLAIAGVCSFFTAATAQPGMGPKRTITVYGTAKKNVEADEIQLSVSIQEYNDDSGLRIGLKELEPRLLKAVNDAGISNADIRVDNISGYGSYSMEGQGFLASKNFLIKAKNMAVVNQLIGKLGDSGVSSVNTMYFSHSQTDTYLRDLKVQALKNAREKAELLLRASNEKPGKAINIEDMEDLNNPMYPGGGPLAYSTQAGDAKPMMKEIGLIPVGLTASIKVTFEIE
jgi:uncharacterized protein YggE